ncbi:MAG TPA: hypothetical protein PKM84_02170 [Candidatus Pacearchaeota archaeon]|nr:hypothetical protein [Candidatus Pacearchaeota archaeon]
MSKKLIGSALLLLSLAGFVGAQQVPAGAPTIDLIRGIKNVMDLLIIVIILVAVLFLLLAGYDFIAAQGNKDAVTKAKDQIFWASVGIAIALLAKGIVDFVFKQVTK